MSTTTPTTGSGTVQRTSAGLLVNVSKKFTLVWNDGLKALAVAAVSPVIPIIAQSISAKTWVFDWTTIWHTAVAAGFAYLTKNFFSTTATVVSPTPANIAAANQTPSMNLSGK
jgi:LPS O-antigen subunit length determinant protein (WzzB/FepE family)